MNILDKDVIFLITFYSLEIWTQLSHVSYKFTNPSFSAYKLLQAVILTYNELTKVYLRWYEF